MHEAKSEKDEASDIHGSMHKIGRLNEATDMFFERNYVEKEELIVPR